MNGYDLQALRAIRRYHQKYGTPPPRIEATAGYRSRMSREYFECVQHPESGQIDIAPPIGFVDPTTTLTCIPVLPLGTGDIIYRCLVVLEVGDSQEQADCTLHEKFHRFGAKLARAGLLIVEPKRTWGLYSYHHTPTYYSQIEVWVFGEEAALNEVLSNHLPGD